MKHLSLLLLFVLCFAACKDEDPMEPEPINMGTMTITKDGGTPVTITTFNNTLLKAVDNGQNARRLDIRATVDGGTFVMTVSNYDSQNPPEDGVVVKTYDAGLVGENSDCTEQGYVTLCDGGLSTYIVGTTTYSSAANFDYYEDPGYITISSIDGANTKVSGSFDVITYKPDQTGEVRFTGTFEDLVYVVQ